MNAWGVAVLLVVLAAAGTFGLWRARTDGRLRTPTPALRNPPPTPTRENDAFISPDVPESALSAALDGNLGSRATLVQFSTVFCQPCRATRRVLAEVTGQVGGVSVVHIDAEDNLDLVRELDVRRTPTVFVLDARGTIVKRAVGQPRKADVIAAIGALG